MRHWLRRRWYRLRSAALPFGVAAALGFERDQDTDSHTDPQTGYRFTHLAWLSCPWWVILLDWVMYAVTEEWDTIRYRGYLRSRVSLNAVLWWQMGYWRHSRLPR